MKRALPLILAFALSGCGNPPHPHVDPPPIIVEKVPVAVDCVDKADIPAEPPKVGGQLTGDAPHDLDIVTASAIHLRNALTKALALLGACTK